MMKRKIFVVFLITLTALITLTSCAGIGDGALIGDIQISGDSETYGFLSVEDLGGEVYLILTSYDAEGNEQFKVTIEGEDVQELHGLINGGEYDRDKEYDFSGKPYILVEYDVTENSDISYVISHGYRIYSDDYVAQMGYLRSAPICKQDGIYGRVIQIMNDKRISVPVSQTEPLLSPE